MHNYNISLSSDTELHTHNFSRYHSGDSRPAAAIFVVETNGYHTNA